MATYSNNTVETKLIKNILQSTYIPSVSIWKPGMEVVAGMNYISKDYVLKANVSGNPNDVFDTVLTSESLVSQPYFDILSSYIKGKFFKGITSNFISNTSVYDAMTHYRLGKYLRYLRDIYDIDLMSLYNCWDGSHSDRVRIISNGSSIKVINNNKIRDGLDTLLIPIELGKDYYIYVNTDTEVKICSIFYNGDQQISNTPICNYKLYSESRSSNPIYYSTKSIKDLNGASLRKDMGTFGEYLTLVIQLNETVAKKVVVLEADTTGRSIKLDGDLTAKELDYSQKELFDHALIKNYCVSPSSLINHSGQAKPYADSLIQYLIDFAITSDEEIDKNISKMQEYARDNKCKQFNGLYDANAAHTPGVWDDTFRLFLFDLATKNKDNKQSRDALGYVDKVAEEMLTRGWDG